MYKFKTLDIYLLNSCYRNFFATLIVVIGLIGLITLSEQVSRISQIYNFWSVLKYSAITAISEIHNYLPMSLAIGSLVSLGRMSNLSELVIMQTIGYSKMRIIFALLGLSLPVAAVDIAMSQTITPVLKEYANAQKYNGNRDASVHAGEPNVWFKLNDQYMYAEFLETNQIHNLKIYTQLASGELQLNLVNLAVWDKDKNTWILNNITRYKIPNISKEIVNSKLVDLEPHNISKEFIKSEPWNVDFNLSSINLSASKLNDISLTALAASIKHMSTIGIDTNQAKLIFYNKLFSPIIYTVMILISLSLVFTNLRSTSIIKRVFIGIFISILFYISNQTFGQVSVIYNVPALISSLLPSIVLLLFAVYKLIN